MPGCRQPVPDGVQALLELRVIGCRQERVEHRCLEVEVVVDPAEDHVEFADDQLEQVDLGFEHMQDVLLDSALRHQVGQDDIVALANFSALTLGFNDESFIEVATLITNGLLA